ncbi:Uncharacterised protein [Chromobacterium violaceum]|uniref:Uncharacterized protein n=1 Tax=Chromobacterium violaceum TaxID=536 RepID=A0A3S4IEL4_CHRVL|nr:Uncharacterised protein [Chromobacterium violaceum]
MSATSRTVRPKSSGNSCSTTATRRAKEAADWPQMSAPSSLASPASGLLKRKAQRSVLVLPLPLGPMTPTNSPGRTVSAMSRSSLASGAAAGSGDQSRPQSSNALTA